MRHTTCPRCKHKNLGEDNFCENCLANLVILAPNGFYSRWLDVMKR
ncbi:hypothetical protein H6503_04115 [Candidatus Woesearchaeota archaeon]|nr:hypothetical protein [Candidatus Woesearchaeota archaeon]